MAGKDYVAIKVCSNILKRWGCSNSGIQTIIGISEPTDTLLHSQPEAIVLSSEQLVRVSYILNIHALLRSTFENPENIKGFMTFKNHSAFFAGRAPIELIRSGRVVDLKTVFEVLKNHFSLKEAAV
ncbi:DUF2384 domain-containing protein [Parashewanella tropica]|uniref:DUF2384 domain-containing protein n=1 Tax=Parashewanella tropica TaxID=2547970 RepID=UPI0010593F55|nr:DUF2384 domain-containing protein [Parashewanella tropica]